MASEYTSNYSLPQWDMDDRILVEEFNEALHNIDDALSIKAQVRFGSYEGDGNAERTIALGVTPKAVLLLSADGASSYYSSSKWNAYGGLALAGSDVTRGSYTILRIVTNGFKVYMTGDSNDSIATNQSGVSYNYIAFY